MSPTDFDDDEGASESGDSATSNLSDIEDDTRAWILLDPDTCRAHFFHSGSGSQRVCGKSLSCQRSGHRSSLARGQTGYYRAHKPLTKKSPADGDTHTFRTVADVEAEMANKRASDRFLFQAAASSPALKQAGQRDPPDLLSFDDSAARAVPSIKVENSDDVSAAGEGSSDLAPAKLPFSSPGVSILKPASDRKITPDPVPPPPPNVPTGSTNPTDEGAESWERVDSNYARLWEGEIAARKEADSALEHSQKAKKELVLMVNELNARIKSMSKKKKVQYAPSNTGPDSFPPPPASSAPAPNAFSLPKTAPAPSAPAPATVTDPAVLNALASLTAMVQKLTVEQERLTLSQQDSSASMNVAGHSVTSTAPATVVAATDGVLRDSDIVGNFPYGPDTSTGPSDIYGINALVSPRKVLEALCPTQIPSDAIDALGEILPDTGAMPGTFAMIVQDSETELVDKLGIMLQQLNNDSSGRNDYGMPKDTQWKSSSRTQLRVNWSEAKFDTTVELYGQMEAEYRMGFSTSVAGILGFIPWVTPAQIETFISAGRLHEIFAGCMMFYKNLLLKVEKMVQEAGWDYARVLVDYYAMKLITLRAGSVHRISLVFRTYLLLRESNRMDFMTSQAQAKITKFMMIRSNSQALARAADAVIPACTVCGVAHKASPCPLRDLPAGVAATLAQTAGPASASRWRVRAVAARRQYVLDHPPAEE